MNAVNQRQDSIEAALARTDRILRSLRDHMSLAEHASLMDRVADVRHDSHDSDAVRRMAMALMIASDAIERTERHPAAPVVDIDHVAMLRDSVRQDDAE